MKRRSSHRGTASAHERITALAEQRAVHEAFRWFHLHHQQLLREQAELVAIPAPPFAETLRSEWIAARFTAIGLESVITDAVGNVMARLPLAADPDANQAVVLVSAHLDTVFPIDTPLAPALREDRLEAPGACDNATGVIGMLALAQSMLAAAIRPGAELWFVGNVGEEGEGDLRGMRHLYQHAPFRHRIRCHIVLDGAGAESAVTQALGSRRFQVRITGPGGHSFTDAGTANPILALSDALTRLAAAAQIQEASRTTFSVGTIHGGTSVNSIPESATAAIDFRSIDPNDLLRLEVALHRAVEDAVDRANDAAEEHARKRQAPFVPLRAVIEKIGDRPTGALPDAAPLLETLCAVDRHLQLRTDPRLGSTDANWPLSLGIPAISLGAGGEGGSPHTRAEWYCATDRELGLKRILLLTLAMLEQAATTDSAGPTHSTDLTQSAGAHADPARAIGQARS